jgi:hypothetical protein
MTYKEYKNKIRKEIDSLPLHFAFSEEQLNSVLEKLQCERKDLIRGPQGSFIHKNDITQVSNYFAKDSSLELKEYLTDEKFFEEAFKYELRNHECGYSGDYSEALEALCIDEAFVEKNNLEKIFTKTWKGVMNESDF